MEAATSLISSASPFLPLSRFLSRTPISSSVPTIHEQAPHAMTSMQTTSVPRQFPASVLRQEQRDETFHITQDETLQALPSRRRIEIDASSTEEETGGQYYRYLEAFDHQLLHGPGLWYLFSMSCPDEKQLLPSSTASVVNEMEQIAGIKPCTDNLNSSDSMASWEVLALAKRALMASKEAASLAESSVSSSAIYGAGPGKLGVMTSTEGRVRSNRLLGRRSIKRRVPKIPKDFVHRTSGPRMPDTDKNKDFNSNDPLRLFLLGPETKQLLTVKEEWDLSNQVQELMRLEEVKQKLQIQFGREPTLVEWAKAVDMTCRDLRFSLHSGNRSKHKMVIANFRLVVHVAKQYQNRGLSFEDLLQEGSMGLMRSLEKFKPEVGCRFSTYAYWWIRQSIRRAITQNSRTIRLPENVYALLTQIRNAKRLYREEGHNPTNNELAKRVGISVEKLEMLLVSAQYPISIQQTAWKDQNVTYQEITADPEVETPEIGATKQMMRQHIRNLLGVLSPRERHIIQLRFGIQDGEVKTLSEIGAVFGLCKERVRQVESRALQKLKSHLSSEGLGAYSSLLI